ncbi:MAG: TrkA family potassium uptake protein [Chloroflexi bacterium]|nr:TrkA family potassium uptake protein [Chloroflexota bacterium]
MPRKQVVVIGLGRFGSEVAKTLYQEGHDVLAIDNDERRVQEMAGHATYPVKADATNEAALRELGVPNFDVAVVAIGNDIEASIMSTVLLKTLGTAHIVARARDPLHGRTLERVGANVVVYPEQETAERVARSLFQPHVLDYIELAPSFGVSKVRLPEAFNHMTLKQAGLAGPRDKYGLAVLAVRRGKEIILLPSEEERLQSGDLLLVAGRDELLEKFSAS